ncbi:hypothetical protein PVT67_07120 [Gallaecimonas kandeliae]|uniref:hypothetical protein n=1 Tax=Gallaecimonas kandeliae TaxID=3029055 RepID=UPI0026492BB0|nr:hypothetical protein [Gallaecimonas kandeliae]WKE67001.1 hypothetical protein PVT67_07120 [Gallaecimonas kandeliae]
MKLVPAKQIKKPRLVVSPAPLVMALLGLGFALLVLGLALLPLNEGLRLGLQGALALLMLGMARNLWRHGLASLVANGEGLYFLSEVPGRFYLVPWQGIGVMEKAMFPLNRKGLRIEVLGHYAAGLQKDDLVPNTQRESGRFFVYTLPQLHSRDSLLRALGRFRTPEREC